MRLGILAASVASLVVIAAPALAAAKPDQKAIDALNAMKGLSVIAINGWQVGNSGDVYGKGWTGGSLSGNKLTIGTGGAGSIGASSYSTLTVGGNMSNGAVIQNGATRNGTVATTGQSGSYGLTVMGSVSAANDGITFDAAGSSSNINNGVTAGAVSMKDQSYLNIASGGAKLITTGGGSVVNVGGNVTTGISTSAGTASLRTQVNVSGELDQTTGNYTSDYTSIKAGNYRGDANSLGSNESISIAGANQTSNASPPSGWVFNTGQTPAAPTAATMTTPQSLMKTNMVDLVSQLGSLQATGTITNYGDAQNSKLLFDSSNNSNGYAIFQVSAADLSVSSLTLGFNTHGFSGPIVVNVTGIKDGNFSWNVGGAYTGNGGSYDSSYSSRVIWNLVDATANSTLNITNQFEGSILDPLGTIHNTNSIEGTVVAGMFFQDGEVHLGTLLGDASAVSSDAAFTALATPVPEPATWAMLVLGFGVVGGAVRRQRRSSATPLGA